MTDEEVIKFLQSKQIPQCGDKEYTADEEYEAYQRAIDALEQQPIEDMPCVTPEEMQKCKDIVKKYTPKQQPSDTVSRGAFEQVMWERDVAIGQLKELGYELGQKIEPCDDAVSRQAVLDLVNSDWKYEGLETDVASLPPVTPQQKYGKWIDREIYDADRWKCSECGRTEQYQENYCPHCGCYMIDPQESEDKE